MTPETFAFWLQGFVELQESDNISEKQWLVIKDHLKLVFEKVTPERLDQLKLTPVYTDLIGTKFNWPIDTSRITC